MDLVLLRKVSLNKNVFDFSVKYNSIDQPGMVNVHKYLMTSTL